MENCDSISQQKCGMEGPKRKNNRIMGLTVETQNETYHLQRRTFKDPHRKQCISYDIQGRSHKIPTSKLILPHPIGLNNFHEMRMTGHTEPPNKFPDIVHLPTDIFSLSYPLRTDRKG